VIRRRAFAAGERLRGMIVAAATLAACGKGKPADGAVGGAVAAAVRAGLDTGAGERAPWRCGALDGPAPAAASFTVGAVAWAVDGRVARRAERAGGRRPVAIAFVADAEAPTPETLSALAAIRGKLARLKVDAVVALGGMAGDADGLAAVYRALAGPWPVVAIPGDREPLGAVRQAVAALAGDGVVDGTQLRWLVIDGVGVATLPGQPHSARLAHGPDGCGHTDADVRALLAAAPDGLAFRVLASQRAPRGPGDRAALGAPAGDPGLAAALVPAAGARRPADLVVHGSLDGRATAAGDVRPGEVVPAIATGVASASPRLDGAGRRVTAAAIVVTIDARAARWQVIAP
jgi:hypothetical protein